MSTSQAASDYKAVSVDGKRDKYVRERIVNPYLQSPSGPLRFSGSSIGVAGVSSPPIAKASEVRQEVTSVVPDSDKDWSGFVVANFPNEESGGHVGVGLGFGEEDFHFRGGVTLDNIGQCFADGARAFVGGSAIIGQTDVRLVIREFRNQVLRTRRKLLIQKANELGGTELVNKWIDLHVIGKKKDELQQIATELGYQ